MKKRTKKIIKQLMEQQRDLAGMIAGTCGAVHQLHSLISEEHKNSLREPDREKQQTQILQQQREIAALTKARPSSAESVMAQADADLLAQTQKRQAEILAARESSREHKNSPMDSAENSYALEPLTSMTAPEEIFYPLDSPEAAALIASAIQELRRALADKENSLSAEPAPDYSDIPESEWIPLQQAANILGRSWATVQGYCRQGKLPWRRVTGWQTTRAGVAKLAQEMGITLSLPPGWYEREYKNTPLAGAEAPPDPPLPPASLEIAESEGDENTPEETPEALSDPVTNQFLAPTRVGRRGKDSYATTWYPFDVAATAEQYAAERLRQWERGIPSAEWRLERAHPDRVTELCVHLEKLLPDHVIRVRHQGVYTILIATYDAEEYKNTPRIGEIDAA